MQLKRIPIGKERLLVRRLYIKTGLVMRLITILMLASTLQISAKSTAQKVTLNKDNATLGEILNEIHKQTGYLFLYDSRTLEDVSSMDIHVKRAPLQDALDESIARYSLGYLLKDSTILVFKKNETKKYLKPSRKIEGTVTDETGQPLTGVTVRIKGSNIGTITDANGKFSIDIPGNETVLQLSYLGFKALEITVGNQSTLTIQMTPGASSLEQLVVVGYGVQKKVDLTGSVSTIGSKELKNRPMVNLSSGLGGLAAGVQVRQGSGQPGSDGASILIRGQGTFEGSNSPMIVIDGVVVDEGNAINAVNPEDVKSISILKDAASAAIYGSRAANGVILITTKSGKFNSKPVISYSALFARSSVSSKFKIESNTAEWMAMHNRAVANLDPVGVSADPTLLPYKQSDIDTWRAASENPNGTDNQWGIPNYLAYPNTDWTKFFYFPSFFNKHTLSVTGGGENTAYYLAGGYQSNPGTMPNTSLDEYSMRVNIETKIAKIIKLGTKTSYNQRYGDVANPTTGGALYYINQMVPAMTPEYDGKYGALEDPTLNASMNPQNMENPLARLMLQDGKHITSRLNTTWYLGAEIFKGLNAEVKFNYRDVTWDQREHDVHIKRYSFRTNEVLADYNGQLDLATTSRSFTRQVARNLIGTLHYNKTFGKHSVSALLGYEQNYWDYNGFSASKKGLLDYSITDITTGTELNSIGGSYERDYAMLSQFGRVNYSYMEKYLFEANFRRDGSSRFAPGHRYGIFPSVSAGWRLSEENFFKPLKDIVNSLKLRASWGKLGNVTSSYYAWQALYAPTNLVLNETETKGLYPSQLPNTSLSWEHVTTTDIGLDAQFLDQRLNVELDYYNRLTKGILTTPTSYSTRGDITIPMQNAASVRNNGFEINLNWRDKVGDFHYAIGGNFSYNRNDVVKYLGKVKYGFDESDFDVWGNPVWKYLNYTALNGKPEGHKLGEQFLQTPYHGNETYYNKDGSVNPNGGPNDGMIRTSSDLKWVEDMVAAGYKFNSQSAAAVDRTRLWYGEYIYADNNGDGNYGNEYDRLWTGKSSVPVFNFGISLSAEWKGFDMSMLWSGQGGMYYHLYGNGLNNPRISNVQNTIPANARQDFYFFDETKYSRPEDDPNSNYLTAPYSRLKTSGGTFQSNTDFLYNATYVKLKNLQIGYTFPKKLTEKVKISNLRIFFSGENILTITNFPGVDPEIGGVGFGVYPLPKMFSGGINVSF